jgi:hypothetical protein
MADLAAQLHADRAVRDSSLSLVKADFAHLKAEYRRKGLAERTMDRLKDGASEVYDEAVEAGGGQTGVLAGLAGVLLLWFMRHPILQALGLGRDGDHHDNHDEDEDGY